MFCVTLGVSGKAVGVDPAHKDFSRQRRGRRSRERETQHNFTATNTLVEFSEVSKLVDRIITVEPVLRPPAIVKDKEQPTTPRQAGVGAEGEQ